MGNVGIKRNNTFLFGPSVIKISQKSDSSEAQQVCLSCVDLPLSDDPSCPPNSLGLVDEFQQVNWFIERLLKPDTLL